MTSHRWWVEVLGDDRVVRALDAFVDGLRLEDIEGRWAISSSEWDLLPLSDPIEARRPAVELVSAFLQSQALGWLTAEVQVAARAWEMAGSRVVRQAVLPPIQGRLDITLAPITGHASGDSAPAPQQAPRRLIGDRVLAFKRRGDEKGHAFACALEKFRTCGTDIPGLWVAFEYIRNALGGFGSLAGKGWAPREDLTAFADTVDKWGHRHAQNGKTWSPPSFPEMDGQTARQLVHRLLIAWLDEEEPA